MFYSTEKLKNSEHQIEVTVSQFLKGTTPSRKNDLTYIRLPKHMIGFYFTAEYQPKYKSILLKRTEKGKGVMCTTLQDGKAGRLQLATKKWFPSFSKMFRSNETYKLIAAEARYDREGQLDEIEINCSKFPGTAGIHIIKEIPENKKMLSIPGNTDKLVSTIKKINMYLTAEPEYQVSVVDNQIKLTKIITKELV